MSPAPSTDPPDGDHERTHAARVLQFLAESVDDYAMLALDQDGKIIGCNHGALYIFGYRDEEILGQSLAAFLTEQDRAARVHERELRDALLQGRALDERWHVRKDGSLLWARGLTVPIRESDGALIGFGKIFRDSGDLKQLHEALQNRALELARANEDKSVFIATLAHELRSPLAALKQTGKVLELAPHVDREQIAQMIGRQVDYIQRLIDDLMDLTRAGRGKLQLQLSRLDLREIVDRSIEMTGPQAEGAGIAITVAQPPAPVTVSADPQRLLQIFGNLLSNAVKFSARGMRIDVTVDEDGDQAMVHVLDHGAGIPGDQLESIFELFSQGRNASAAGDAGLGIGLALTRDLVRLHGATIQVLSEGPGKGSEFVVRLPIARVDVAG